MTFCISVMSVVIFPLSFLILLTWVLSLFLVSLAKSLLILFVHSKKSSVGYIDLFPLFVFTALFPLWPLLLPSFS